MRFPPFAPFLFFILLSLRFANTGFASSLQSSQREQALNSVFLVHFSLKAPPLFLFSFFCFLFCFSLFQFQAFPLCVTTLPALFSFSSDPFPPLPPFPCFDVRTTRTPPLSCLLPTIEVRDIRRQLQQPLPSSRVAFAPRPKPSPTHTNTQVEDVRRNCHLVPSYPTDRAW